MLAGALTGAVRAESPALYEEVVSVASINRDVSESAQQTEGSRASCTIILHF